MQRKWDGTNWSNIGIQGVIEVVKRNGPNLYAGGIILEALAAWRQPTLRAGTGLIGLRWGPAVSGAGFKHIGKCHLALPSRETMFTRGW